MGQGGTHQRPVVLTFLRPGTFALTILLGILTAVGPLSTDMYLPALPDIRADLGTTTKLAQATLSGFMLGFGFAQTFYGPISDRRGRKPVLLASLGIYCCGCLFCSFAPSIEALIAARFVQAVGAAGSSVIIRAVVRDLFHGAEAGREMSRMASIMAVVPALAPIAGAGIAALFGWRAVFLTMTIAGPVMASLVYFKLPETLHAPVTTPFSIPQMLRDFARIARNRTFTRHALIGAFGFSGFFCFLSAASFVLQGVYGLNPLQFSGAFMLTVLGYLIGSAVAQRFVMRLGLQRMIATGIVLIVCAASLALAGSLAIHSPWPIILGMPGYQFGLSFLLAQCNASAMQPFKESAGSASSLFAVMQMCIAAAIGALVGHYIDMSPLVLPAATLASALMAAFVLLATRRLN